MKYRSGSIETMTGKEFHPYGDNLFDICDISHALGNICRFGGHCKEFYSVATHSVLVAELMEELGVGDPFEGLMHDAVEAYVGDTVAPFKQYFPALVEVEDMIDGQIRAQWGLPALKTASCAEVDSIAYFIEALYLTNHKGAFSHDDYGLRAKALELAHPGRIRPEKTFLEKYLELSAKRLDMSA